MRTAFVLPGLHRVSRGAEIAFESVARELARANSHDVVTLIGTGVPRSDEPYRFIPTRAVRRERFERFPKIPLLRSVFAYEELTGMPSLAVKWRPADFDVSVTCSYPFTNWLLGHRGGNRRPAHVFVTQNGDWPAYSRNLEYRQFTCDGLVCTNPEYFERNRDRWHAALIPNGVDTTRFHPGPSDRRKFGLPTSAPIVLMVSALDANKRVLDGIAAVAKVRDAFLVVAGDGGQREMVDRAASELLPGRFMRFTLRPHEMPDLYRSADVFMHLAKFESFGNVYLEAMCSGLPVVAHDSPVSRWIMGPYARLLDTTDLDAVAATIQDVMTEGLGRRDEMVAATTARFDWRTVAFDYRRFLADVVGRRERGRST